MPGLLMSMTHAAARGCVAGCGSGADRLHSAQRKRLEAKIAAEKAQVRAGGAWLSGGYWVAVPRDRHPRRPNSQPPTHRSLPARAATQPRHTPACLPVPVPVCEQIERDAVGHYDVLMMRRARN
jgi:hypothetical protein